MLLTRSRRCNPSFKSFQNDHFVFYVACVVMVEKLNFFVYQIVYHFLNH